MATDCLFRDDYYLKQCDARVVAITGQGGIVLDRTVFYANSGGQPGDTGALTAPDGTAIAIANAVYTDAAKSEIAHIPARRAPRPSNPAIRSPRRSTGTDATPACACTPRCICSRPCCLMR